MDIAIPSFRSFFKKELFWLLHTLGGRNCRRPSASGTVHTLHPSSCRPAVVWGRLAPGPTPPAPFLSPLTPSSSTSTTPPMPSPLALVGCHSPPPWTGPAKPAGDLLPPSLHLRGCGDLASAARPAFAEASPESSKFGNPMETSPFRHISISLRVQNAPPGRSV